MTTTAVLGAAVPVIMPFEFVWVRRVVSAFEKVKVEVTVTKWPF